MKNIRARLQVLFSAWIAVSALIMSVACSKGGGQTLPTPPAVKPTPAQVKTPTGGDQTPGAKQETPDAQQASNPNDNGSSTSSQAKVQQQAPPDDGNPATSPAAAPKPVAPAKPANSPIDGVVVMDPTGMTPDEIFDSSARQGHAFRGLKATTGGHGVELYYSGAGQDFLHEQLLAKMNSESALQKDRDRKFAREIGMTTFEFDENKREGKVSLNLTVDGKKTNLNFTGKLDNKMRLRAGNLKKGNGIAVEATCMDVGGGCHTTLIRVLKKVGGGTAMAQVVARLTNAYLYIDGNAPGVSQNPEYDNLMNLLLNTVTNPNGPDSVQALGFYTAETIGGQSNFAVLMRLGIQDANKPRGDGQVLGMMGALVKPAQSTNENFLIPGPPTIATVVGGRTFLLPTEIANTIRDVRVVRNDGRGNLQFYITVRKSTAGSSEDTIRLTVARLQEATRQLD